MKRRGFIKVFAAACVVPVVAAKAIASHKRTPTDAEVNKAVRYLYDLGGSSNAVAEWKDYETVKMECDGEAWFIRPEDAPISKLHRGSAVEWTYEYPSHPLV